MAGVLAHLQAAHPLPGVGAPRLPGQKPSAGAGLSARPGPACGPEASKSWPRGRPGPVDRRESLPSSAAPHNLEIGPRTSKRRK